ncbi:TetR/AcrR family transcriptional regulator [Actinokineospora spheciospongiae]|uniref:TetR/AcrR family transcriptional regulator n=1 Tax=Actinokineospora spheciospongiae TaxID=909613 RepID=UPI000D70CCCF|nr:TetR/AcrR family transcriptional regulator [Actinokineospora spheciospongiae]PWW56831.1 TetR family transcriptional regulator [Actinokineospora spheciospongiae]
MVKIADRAGVRVGTVYRHFATRGELVGALVHGSFGLAVDTRGQPPDHPGPAAEGVRLFFLATLRDRERFVLPLAARRSSPPPPASARRTSAPPCARSSTAVRPGPASR